MKTYPIFPGLGLLILLMTCFGCRGPASTSTANGQTAGDATPTATRVVGGLQEPVALAFLTDTILLVAERRSGRIRWIEGGRLRQAPFATLPVPRVAGYEEHGLLGLTVDRNYPTRPYVYAFHTVPNAAGRPARQRIVRFTVSNGRGTALRTIVDHLPVSASCCHFGGRILFAPDGLLYASVGDTQRPQTAQQVRALSGKILRYTPDGTVPASNPFTVNNRRSPVFTLGHRNPFGIAANPANGALYITDNGPDRNDEINHLVAGSNYGWPDVTGYTNTPRFRSPIWASGRTVVAPTGAVFYTGSAFPQFRGNLLFANYVDGRLRRVVFNTPDAMRSIEVISQAGTNARLDVALSPNGTIYYSSMNAIYRLDAR